MAKNYVQPGKTLTLVAPSGGVTTGLGYLIGALFVVALQTIAETLPFEGATSGVWDLVKTSAQAWTEGQKIYWNVSTSKADSDGTTGPLIGVAAAVADNPSSTGYVRLNGAVPATAEGPQGAIVVLTDSTGGSGTHDDTLADGLTATAPGAITDYTAHAAGGTTVTSNAATDLDTTAAALALLVDEVTALRAVVAALVTDVTVQNQNDSDLAQKVIEIRAALVAAGIIAA